jgi:hypothetical protein
MRFTKLSLFIAGAVGILMLGVPRAAHAVAAALVQVANTASSPVINQGIGNQAAQIVQIECTYNPGGFPTQCVAVPATGITPYAVGAPPYVVPAGETLVVTAVDRSAAMRLSPSRLATRPPLSLWVRCRPPAARL